MDAELIIKAIMGLVAILAILIFLLFLEPEDGPKSKKTIKKQTIKKQDKNNLHNWCCNYSVCTIFYSKKYNRI